MENPPQHHLRAAVAAALLLALALLSVVMPPRPAEAIIERYKAPTLTVSKSSVVVNEGQTATKSGSFDDSVDSNFDTVHVTASVGIITHSSTREEGTWNWSYATTNFSDDTPPFVPSPHHLQPKSGKASQKACLPA